MDVPHRFKSPMLLFWGGVFGILGFLFTFCIGVLNFCQRTASFTGEPYPSGHGYWPATVSEMVDEWSSPEGRIFFGFSLISATLIFQSWYPYNLRNVFTGSEMMHEHIPLYWISFRQMVPVCGLLMLISVPVVPSVLARVSDEIAVGVHLLGAGMMFVGYIVAELKCLQMLCFTSVVQDKYLSIEGPERSKRKVLMVVVLLSYLTFCFCQMALVVAKAARPPLCCADVVDTGRAAQAGRHLSSALIDTASGMYLLLKVSSFVSEVVSGLALIGSHVVIWYYCEERHVNFAEAALCTVFDEEKFVELPLERHTTYTSTSLPCLS